MSDTLLLFLAACYVVQAVGFGIAGDSRKCGFGQAFTMCLFTGPLAALAFVLLSEKRPEP